GSAGLWASRAATARDARPMPSPEARRRRDRGASYRMARAGIEDGGVAAACGAAESRARPVRAAAARRRRRRSAPRARIPGRLARGESADGRRPPAGALLARRRGLRAPRRFRCAGSGGLGELSEQALLRADRRFVVGAPDERVRAVRL